MGWFELFLGTLIGWLLHGAQSYVTRKGHNLADKEDIAKITREVESVRHEFSQAQQEARERHETLLKEGDRRHQLRLAAAERRLEAYQGAFKVLRRMLPGGKKGMATMIEEADEFLDAHAVYLSQDALDAFARAMRASMRLAQLGVLKMAASDDPRLREIKQTSGPKLEMSEINKEIKAKLEERNEAMGLIFNDVGLPALGNSSVAGRSLADEIMTDRDG